MVAIVSVSGHFHHILKQSTVIFSSQKKFLYKDHLSGNYRPISLTFHLLSKVIELVVKSRLPHLSA